MRRKVINKSFAIRMVIVFFAALLALSVFPFRIWQRDMKFEGDAEPDIISENIDDYHDAVQKFMAQYDRLSSIEVFVDEVKQGKYMSFVFYDENMTEMYERYYYLGDVEAPGFVKIPVGLDLEVGKTYTYLIRGCYSTFNLGFEENDAETSPYILDFAYHDTGAQGQHLSAIYHYEQPLSKEMSLGIIGGVALVAALLCLLVWLFYRNKKDKLITVQRVIKFVGNPIAVVITLALMISIYPLQIFDDRLADIVFYEIGAVITGLCMLYAINHESDATLDTKLWHRVTNFIQMCMIAGALWFCCEYMNALYTIYQTLAERKELIFLLLFLCFSITKERLFKLYNLVYAVAGVIAGLYYRNAHLLADTEKEYDLHNAATTYGVIIVLLAGFLIINLIAEIIAYTKKKKNPFAALKCLSFMGVLVAVFMAVIIIFRNTRWWGVVLAAFTFGLMLCFANFGFVRLENTTGDPEKNGARSANGYSELVIGGLLLNFAISMVYSWLYRPFTAFNTGRYPFVFHTVTVTAEYMTVMECAAIVLLLYKIYDTRGIARFKDRFRYMWKEFIIFGFVSAYMIFTMSRTAYLACIVMFICVVLLTLGDVKEYKFRYFLRQLVTLALAVMIAFPAAFTLQRIIPSVVKHPKKYLVESGNFSLYGAADPDNRLYMGIERFADLFAEKILDTDLMDYNYPEDRYNYDSDGNPIYGETGIELTKEQSENRITDLNTLLGIVPETEEAPVEYTEEVAAPAEEVAEEPEEETSEDGIESFSNGRITIFKSYLQQMNLFGHDEMGAELPWGEIAVHAHNTYIQVMYDNGILSGALYLLLMFTSFVSGAIYYRKNREKEHCALLPYAMTVGFGIAALSEWVFQFSNPMTIAFVLSLMPICFADRKKS